MNKVELVASVAEKAGLAKKDAEKAVAAVLESIVSTVASGTRSSWLASVPLRSVSAAREPAGIPAPRKPS